MSQYGAAVLKNCCRHLKVRNFWTTCFLGFELCKWSSQTPHVMGRFEGFYRTVHCPINCSREPWSQKCVQKSRIDGKFPLFTDSVFWCGDIWDLSAVSKTNFSAMCRILSTAYRAVIVYTSGALWAFVTNLPSEKNVGQIFGPAKYSRHPMRCVA